MFSADFSADQLSYRLLWSGVGGQLLSYRLLWSGVGGQLLSYHLLWSGVGGQLLSYRLLWSGVGGQLLSYHLLWSGVGGQLLSYHVGGQYCTSSSEGSFRGAFGKNPKFMKKSRIPNKSQPLQHSLLTAFIALIKAQARVGL